jgi:hypothetical protein
MKRLMRTKAGKVGVLGIQCAAVGAGFGAAAGCVASAVLHYTGVTSFDTHTPEGQEELFVGAQGVLGKVSKVEQMVRLTTMGGTVIGLLWVGWVALNSVVL